MKFWELRGAFGGIVGACVATGVGLLLAITASAATPSLTLTATDGVVGQALSATAELSEAPGAAGIISFEVFGPGDPTCLGPAITPAPASASVSGEGEYTSGDFTPTDAGTYRWTAHYSGDDENPAADSTCSAASSVAKASPALAGSASSATAGATISDTATLSAGFAPGGEIAFSAYGPGDPSCAGPAAYEASVAVAGNGPYSPPGFAPGAGVYRWVAEYEGDANNAPAATACGAANQSSSVAKASPALAGSASSATAGATISDTATLSAGFAPGGEIAFSAYGPGDPSCAGPAAYEASVAVAGNGPYSPPGFAPGAGVYRWVAEYEGDANNAPAATACGAANQSSSVAKASPALAGSASSATAGATISDTATLSAGFAPGGEIAFSAYGPGDPSCAGPAAYEASVAVAGNGPYSPPGFAPGAGVYRWVAEYEGDANNAPAATACGAANQSSSVAKASPALAGSASSATAGATISDTATLSAGFAPGGEIAFSAYGPGDPSCAGPAAYEASVAVAGNGPYSPPGFAPGAGVYRWVAEYEGDANNAPAATACGAANQSSSVAKASPALAGSASSATAGATISDTATLSAGFAPGGEIAFSAYGPGDPSCAGPAAYEASVAVAGNGPYSPPGFAPGAGVYRWVAEYEGDANNAPAATACGAANQSSSVAKASPALAGSASSATAGATISDTATLSAGFAPGGEIAFSAYGPGDPSCAGPAAYEASVAVAGNGPYSPPGFAPGAGVYRWVAEYEGDANNAPAATACGAANQSSSVAKASPALAGSASSATAGATISDTATLSAGFAPGGEIAFSAYGPGDPSCAGPAAYEASVAVAGNGPYSPPGFAPGAGVYRWVAEYEGDANNAPAATACGAANQSSSVAKASPALAGSASSATAGATISDTATLSAGFAPGGEIAFSAYGPGDPSCAGPAAYEASVAVAGNGPYSPPGFAPGAGVYRWVAEYEGDANNAPAATACGAANQSSSVAKASPALAGSASSATAGATISDTATLSAGFAPGGEIAFSAYGPGDPSCAGPAAYEASVAVAGNGPYSPPGFAPGAGVYRWVAEYEGDANNAPAATACGAANQSSSVAKASPALAGSASSATAGATISDTATLSAGFAPGGEIAFSAYGPGDPSCAGPAAYEASVAVAGNGPYSPPGFAPGAGVYRWVAEYEGDANNAPAATACGAANQSSAVGTVPVTLAASATSGTVGNPVSATASIQEGAIPKGQLTFKAFPPSDTNCSGTEAFVSTVGVSGNGSYSSAPFAPSRVGAFRWTVSYSGDPNHTPASVGCGGATSSISQATPSITGGVDTRLTVGTSFEVTATLQGGFAPTGRITFQIYGPVASGCGTPLAVDKVSVNGNGTISSDPFVAQRPGRYSFVATYSGDAANQGGTAPCDSPSQVAQVSKRMPNVKPKALLKGRRLDIRARLSGAVSPSGVVNFRLYRPGDTRCKGKPAYTGGVAVKSNGTYSLAEYLATRSGVYHLSVGYSGDQRNKRYRGSCKSALSIHVG